MITSRYSHLAFVGVLSVLSATSASAMSCAIDANGKTICPTSEQVEEFYQTSQPVACTMDAKMCPDGSYVGRVAPDCAFAACPGAASCAPYVCMDGTTHPSCAEDGTVINYFAEPCLTHGGDAGLFKDVPADHPNANAIAYMKEHGIVEGYADGTFRPDATINRAEFLKILMETETALYDGDGMAPMYGPCFMHETKQQFTAKYGKFPDVDFDAWYGDYFCPAVRMGIIEGYPDGTFRGASSINFVEAAKIIYTFHNFDYDYWSEYDVGVPPSSSEPWYRAYVEFLEGESAIPLSIISFDQKITRGEMVEMIWRLKSGDNEYRTTQTYDTLADPSLISFHFETLIVTAPATFRQYMYYPFPDGPDRGVEGLVVMDGQWDKVSTLDGRNHVRIGEMGECPDLSGRPYDSWGTSLINGNKWSYASGSSGAAGSIQNFTVYTFMQGNGKCAIMTTNAFYSTGDAYDEPMRSKIKQQNAETDALLLRIANSIIVVR